MKKSLPLLSLLTVGLIFGGPVDSVKTSALAANHGKKVSWNLSTWGKRKWSCQEYRKGTRGNNRRRSIETDEFMCKTCIFMVRNSS